MKNMMMTEQHKTPVFTALKEYSERDTVQFDVPGHKQGKGNKELRDYFGGRMMECDLNSMKPLDNIGNPLGVIKESELLLAKAYRCDYGFFLVNGTTQGVQAMILAACRPNEKVILQRNVHKSAIKALILSGAIPVYVQPELDEELSITTGVSVESVRTAIENNKDGKAVFINNPTYYGFTTDLKEIIELAHENNMMVLVDEAHGAHLTFNNQLPPCGMDLGADMAAISLHKTGGSMTQSSALLINENRISKDKVKTILNLTQTTSASYLLMASLDLARKLLATEGKDILDKVIELARYAREEINKIDGLYAFGKEKIDKIGIYNFDETKLAIKVSSIGLNGFDVYNILRDEYSIQVEFGDTHNILAIMSLGDTRDSVQRLIDALRDIADRYRTDNHVQSFLHLIEHTVIMSPREAFYGDKEKVELKKSMGKICGEHIMVYPPGIPIATPGEVITSEMIQYIQFLKKQKTFLTGTEDPGIDYINILK